MDSAKMTQRINFLGDLAGRTSTHIVPRKVELEIASRMNFLYFLGPRAPIGGNNEIEQNNEILFIFNQFKKTEVDKRLNIGSDASPIISSTLPMGKLVKIRQRAQLAVSQFFAMPDSIEVHSSTEICYEKL